MNKIYQQNDTYKKKRTNQKQKYFMSFNSYKKCRNIYRNKSISSGLHQYGKNQGCKGFFITSLPEKSNTPSSTRRELSNKFHKIRQTLKRKSITNFGYKSFEKHESGLYHLHLVVYVPENDSDEFQKIYKSYFKNYVNTNELSFQEITETPEYVDDYLIWINLENDEDEEVTKISSKSDVSFFGLKKGFIKKWDYIYKSKRKNLTQDEFKIKKHMVNKDYSKVLELLDCFNENEKHNNEVFSIEEPERTSKNIMNIWIVITLSIIEQIMYSIHFFYFHGPPLLKRIINFVEKRQYIFNIRRDTMNKINQNRKRYYKKIEMINRVRGPPKRTLKTWITQNKSYPHF